MSFTITSAKLTGNPDEAGWAQVHEFKPEDRQKLKLRGHLFAVVATKRHQEGVDSVVSGRELLGRLHEEYFGSTDTGAFNALKAATEKVITEFSASWGNVEISAVSILDNIAYTAAGGGATVVVFRDGMLAKILVTSKKEVVAASGYPKKGDVLLLATRSFFETFPEGVVKAAMEAKDPATAVEFLAPGLHSVGGAGNLGAVFLKFRKVRPLLKEAVINIKRREKTGPEGATELKKAKVFSFLPKVSNLIETLAKKIPARRIYIRETRGDLEATQTRKLAVSVGAILLLLLFVSIGFGIRQKNVREVKERYQSTLTQAQHEFEEAIDLFSLNPARARQLFSDSRQKVERLLDEGVSDPSLFELRQELDEKHATILGEYEIVPELFVDLSLLSDGFSGDDIAGSEQLFVLDSKGERIISVSLDTKRSEVVAGPDTVANAGSIAAYTDRVFVVSSGGIDEVGEERKQVVAGDLSGEVLAYAYAGNLYVLEANTATIWRHAGIEGGFASGKNWFAQGIEPDLSRIISWTIDGAIWLLNDSGDLFKYSFGNPQDFTVKGVIPELSAPMAIYTNEELKFLYLLEPERDRVVVLEKSGDYKAQYLSEDIGQAKDLVVSEKEGKIILLTGQALYSIELEHLED